ncbi:MAG TPA: hypothetical protein VN808_02085 [Stellaceae bacterium]|nr:hypothetical protein [Stellaceae bacterium]
MGALARRTLLILHQSLQGTGRFAAQLTILALVALLGLAPVFILLMASLYGAYGVVSLIGGGAFVVFLVFWVFVGLIGWYVSPHVQPQISEALKALLKSD